MSGEVIIGAVAVTLDRTAKVERDKFVQTLRLSSRVPLKEHIFSKRQSNTPSCRGALML